MANLNLSEFTEKLFVTDADHTFIWDTANAISKRVSRNSWLNSGTLTSDAPVTISQTWNNAAVAFTGLKVNAVSTASASGSLLLDLQLGGVSLFKVSKTGSITANNTFNLSGSIVQSSGNIIPSNALIFDYFNQDVVLQRDAANTLALRNGAAAQTFRVYNTYSNAGADTEYIQISATSSGHRIGTNSSGTGASRALLLGTGGGSQWNINTSGHLGTFGSDNLYDIGASGANRPKSLYLGTNIVIGTAPTTLTINPSGLSFSGRFIISESGADGVFGVYNSTASGFNRLQFGGVTDAFPAVARDGAGIKFTGAAAGSTAWVKVPAVAVSALPLAATAGVGARAFVNDAIAPVFGSAVTGGGSVPVPVYSTGSAWNVG